MTVHRTLLPAKPSLPARLAIWLGVRRALRRIDRPALEAVRRDLRDTDPAAFESKYWRLESQLAKNLFRARRLRLHRPPRDLSVLDLGTGFGLFPYVCRLHGHRAVGLDLEDGEGSLYRSVTSALGVERLLGAIRPYEPVPVTGRRFDLVTAFAVLFNDPQGRPWGAGEWGFLIGDLAGRVLAPGGRIFLSLNRDKDGRHLDAETEALLRDLGARISGRDVYFPTLDPAALGSVGAPAAARPPAMEA